MMRMMRLEVHVMMMIDENDEMTSLVKVLLSFVELFALSVNESNGQVLSGGEEGAQNWLQCFALQWFKGEMLYNLKHSKKNKQ